MARYTGPATRISRRLNVDLVGGDTSFERRPYPPGQHGRSRIKQSEYLLQLQEKQKAKYSYGVLEKQFRRYYEEAVRRPGKTGDNLLQILESRLDNVVYRVRLGAHSPGRPSAGQPRPLPRQRREGEHPELPGVASTTSSTSSRSRSRRRRSSSRGRPKATGRFPAWLQVVPNRLRVLVHQLPERARSTSRCRSS